jgi:hypothetical protein
MNLSSGDILVSETNTQPLLTVCLVLKDHGWIIEKMAVRLAERLVASNVVAQISYLPSPQVDINHWMIYYDFIGGMYGKNTLAITHVDRPAKLHLLKQRLKRANLGICMSRMTLEELVLCGIPREKLCFISPAHDVDVVPRRIVIGITSQIRPDGAKREGVLIKMAHTIRLDAFHFEIIGPRWEKVIPHLEAAGATVNYQAGAYQDDNSEHLRIVRERMLSFDYYLYMGWDEGSMGTMEALAFGIPTIITPQGFHLDLNGGISFPFKESTDLCLILKNLANERQKRIDSVSGLTWDKYAQQHAKVWRTLRSGLPIGNINSLLHEQDTYTTPLPKMSRHGIEANNLYVYARSNWSAILEDLLLLSKWYAGSKFQQTQLYKLMRMIKKKIG